MLDDFHIEQSGVPIYLQIRDQLLRAIGAGTILPGEQMPTMRQVAVSLKVDLNTVRRAYDAAAEVGAIVILPARGTFVAEAPPRIDTGARAAKVEDLALRTIATATSSGLDPAEVAQKILALTKGQSP